MKWEGETFELGIYPGEPIDTTGAGDMFAAGFFYGIINLNHPVQAGHLASLSAARVVSQFGARLKEDHKELVKHIIENVK